MCLVCLQIKEESIVIVNKNILQSSTQNISCMMDFSPKKYVRESIFQYLGAFIYELIAMTMNRRFV